VLADEMGDFFPEIKNNQLVSKVIREEEESFCAHSIKVLF
jgi:alanyl-tRNA synthetase